MPRGAAKAPSLLLVNVPGAAAVETTERANCGDAPCLVRAKVGREDRKTGGCDVGRTDEPWQYVIGDQSANLCHKMTEMVSGQLPLAGGISDARWSTVLAL